MTGNNTPTITFHEANPGGAEARYFAAKEGRLVGRTPGSEKISEGVVQIRENLGGFQPRFEDTNGN